MATTVFEKPVSTEIKELADQKTDMAVVCNTISSDGKAPKLLIKGQYIAFNGYLYKTNTAILQGNDIVTGTGGNVDLVTVAQQLSSIDELKVEGPLGATSDHVAAFDGITGKLIKDSGYTIAKSIPSDAKFTDTWRGIQDNLTSTSTTDSLSAKQGKILNDHIKVQNAVAWKTYPGANGRYCYYYEGVDATTYDLPTPHCFVVVEWMGSTRGIAMAYKWASASGTVYENALHDSWKGWVRLTRDNEFTFGSVTQTSSANGNIDLNLASASYKVMTAWCSDTSGVVVVPYSEPGGKWWAHCTSDNVSAPAKTNTRMTINFYYMPW